MDTGRRDEVAHVVGFEVFAVLEFLGDGTGLTTTLRDDFLCVEVSVFTLSFGNDSDDVVHLFVDGGVTRDGVDLRECFKPFQEIAVVERRSVGLAVAASFAEAGRHEKVIPGVAFVGVAEDFPEMGNHRRATNIEALAEQTAVPLHIG